MGKLLNRRQIEEILPHRDPFLFVDSITRIEDGASIEGTLEVSDSIRFLTESGGERVLPTAILTEAMAQVGAILVLHPEERRGQTIYFRSIEGASFGAPVPHGSRVEIRAEVRRLRSRFGSLEVAARVAEEEVARAVMSFALG